MTAEEQTENGILDSYRYLRILLPLPAAWLLLAIFCVSLAQGRLLGSISDYYGGPLRDVFVGALMASGVCMIAYKGESRLEDYALNFAGVNAFYVALVPNSFQQLLDRTRAAESEPGGALVSSTQLLQNLKIVVGTFLVVTVVFLIVDRVFMKWTEFRWGDQTGPAKVLIIISWVAEGALAAIICAMWVGMESLLGMSVFTVVHFVAAGLLVVNLSFAAASHAFPAQLRQPEEIRDSSRVERLGFFGSVTAAMWVGVVAGGLAIAEGVPYAVVVTEVVEIVLFVVFWVGATRRAWAPRPPTSQQPSPDVRATNAESSSQVEAATDPPGQRARAG